MQPTPPTYNPVQLPAEELSKIKKTNRLKLVWGIVCLVGPTALIIVSLLAYVGLLFATGGTWQYAHGDSDMLNQPSMIRTIGNIVLFCVGSIAALTWLPGVVVGIVLLATRRRV